MLFHHFNKIIHEELFPKILENFDSEKFNVPAYYQETRFYSLKILLLCLEKFNGKKFFNNKQVEFLQIVLDAIEGEKDPRNILIKFEICAKICKFLDKKLIKDYSKTIFNTLEIYYPIEFTPPKNSPERITAEDLINGLNEAFGSNENYIESLIELFSGNMFSLFLYLNLF